ncbi:hypothetical protein TNCV_4218011 [Trichonephila clavipes]|nr:hypothetical protein TNCV_4218011 [Trichonephila clavipes]
MPLMARVPLVCHPCLHEPLIIIIHSSSRLQYFSRKLWVVQIPRRNYPMSSRNSKKKVHFRSTTRKVIRGHKTTPLRVKEDIGNVSTELGNGGQRLHFLDETFRILLPSES